VPESVCRAGVEQVRREAVGWKDQQRPPLSPPHCQSLPSRAFMDGCQRLRFELQRRKRRCSS
jgi:hypothetical protein